MSTKGGVIVVGSANMDLVFRTPRFPVAGETLPGRSFDTFPGGKGANQAVAIGKLGGAVRFVGKVGSDAFGDELVASLEGAGVDASGVIRDPSIRTGVASINVDDNGQNQIVVVPGANGSLTPDEALRAARGFEGCAVALFQHETPVETVDACILAASRHCQVILNPAPARAVSPSVLACLDLITPNETEAWALTGVDATDDSSCLEAARWFFEKGVRQVVITLGAQGCFYAGPSGHRHFPAPSVQVVDTTAAGDAFNGALACFLAEGREIDDALRLANGVGALSTTKPGAQASMPTPKDLAARRPELG